MMNQSDRLRQVTVAAQAGQELPDFLAERILRIADELEQGTSFSGIDELIDQVGDYDTYGQTGYLGMGINNVILTKTIERIEAQPAC